MFRSAVIEPPTSKNMTIPFSRQNIRAGLILLALFSHFASQAAEMSDLTGYATVLTAKRASLQAEEVSPAAQPGYLGVDLALDSKGRLVIQELAAGSPAQLAGVCAGDVLLKVDGKVPRNVAEARELIQAAGISLPVPLSVKRSGKTLELRPTLVQLSKPMHLAEQRGVLGVQASSLEDGEGMRVTTVVPDSPASRAGLKPGDILLKVNKYPLLSSSALNDALSSHEAGESVTVAFRRGEEEHEFTAELAPAPDRETDVPFSRRRTWKPPLYRLAVIGVEFEDTPHNEKIGPQDWEQFFFSTNVCAGISNVTGQATYGSVNDYYREISCSQFHFEGKVFDWVKLSKNRADYSPGTMNARTRNAFFKELIDGLLEREGTNALRGFDGLAIIYAGERFATANRGTLFWPHRSAANYKGKNWPYVICPEGGKRMQNISVFCHEFGHILGLPDLYARAENPGSEGVGAWCAMSNNTGNGRPQHFSAWCKEQLGWLHPAVLDPRVNQKLILGPVEGSTNECYKIPLRRDGAEYLLLENRQHRGFDQSLPAAGLLIWRVVGNRLMLEESHGVEGPAGPRVFLGSVPYPSAANTAFTPYTTPSSRPQLPGGVAVNLTQIRQLPDGRITFEIGAEFD
jgi:M6 family metalloprotease-like protein